MPSIATHDRLISAHLVEPIRSALPGVGLCVLVTVLAYGLAFAERAVFGASWLEALVLAIIVGTLVRTFLPLDERFDDGVAFSAKYLLELAVVLLGASISAATLLASGVTLLAGIAGLVVVAVTASVAIGRLLGLPARMALLVACGNAICGNSAIAAVAPVIDADSDVVAAAIAFTAVLGVIVVLGLPVLGLALGMNGLHYGALAGLTVYAVPQVIAATAPLGTTAVQMGTLVKLVRVLMLGPVCLVLSFVAPRLKPEASDRDATVAHETKKAGPSLTHLVPWFILGFLAMMACRSFGLIPEAALDPIEEAATILTIVSMAALGLGVDVRTIAKVGGRVTLSVVLSLAVLGIAAFALVGFLPL